MRPTIPALGLLALSAVPGAAAPAEAVGTFLTEDGRARIRTERCGGQNDRLCGYVVWLRDNTDGEGRPKTDRYNPDASRRDRPALGLQLLKGLPLNEDARYAGQIYNADNGKSYDVSIWAENAAELSVRGCLVTYLCKTQTWTRVSDTVPGQLAGLTGAANGPRPDAGYGRTASAAGGAVPRPAARKPVAAAPAAAAPAATAAADE